MPKYIKLNKGKLKKVLTGGIVLVAGITAAAVIITGNSSDDSFHGQLSDLGVQVESIEQFGSIDTENENSGFSLAYCGNHTTKLSDNAKKVLENVTIPTGIVITPSATTLGEIYLDVDYVKNIIATYQVKYPICLNIDEMFINKDNSLGDIEAMINSFADKLHANGCIVVVVGKEENVSKIKNSDLYTKGVVINSATTFISNEYDLILSEEEVCSTEAFSKKITSNGYQTKDMFVGDAEYTIQPGDSLTTIGQLYGISPNNLMIYNGLDSSLIYSGQIIKIPNCYNVKNPISVPIDSEIGKNEVDTNEYYKGIDVSKWQGTIDWEIARQKIDFAIIRIADAGNRDEHGNIKLDPCFKYNIEECNRLGIPVGAYIYSRADNHDKLTAELKFVLAAIEPYNITLPIYLDLEGERAEALVSSEESRKIQIELTDKFCSVIEQAGYPSGVYLHKKYLNCIPELGNKYSIWAQGGYYYGTECSFDDMQYAMETATTRFDLTYRVNIFQPTEKGSTDGLGISSQYVDFDYVDQNFVDNLIKKYDKQGNVHVKKRN